MAWQASLCCIIHVTQSSTNVLGIVGTLRSHQEQEQDQSKLVCRCTVRSCTCMQKC